ncbi:MAG: OmpA family protein [Bacteroidota bacterium]
MRKHIASMITIFSLALISVTGGLAQDTSYRTVKIIQPPLFTGNSGFRTWSIGLNAGVMAPFAASGGRNDFSNWQATLGYGGYLKFQTSHVFGLQLDILRGSLKANNDKLWAGQPPVSPYKSFNTEVHWATSLSGVVTLGNINWSQLHTSIQPYLSIGGGAINFKATNVTAAGTTVEYSPERSLTEFYVPFGLGIKANLSQSVNLDLGYKMAFVDADNLDGYLKAPYNGDKFSYAHIGLEFILGNKSKPQLARHNPPAQLAQNMKDRDDALSASLAASEERYNQRLAELNGLRSDLAKMKMDSDNDGVSDYFDKCPNTPAGVKVDGAGCALPVPPPPVRDTVTKVYNNTYVITEEDRKVVSEAIRNLEFDFGKATIRTRSLPYLTRVAELLVKKGFSLKLAGHTDNVGSEAANMRLSKNRAESVRNYLLSQNVSGARVEAVGYGKSQPVASNKTDAGRQKNRRVEFTLY